MADTKQQPVLEGEITVGDVIRAAPLSTLPTAAPVITTTRKEIIAFGIPVSALFISNFALGAVDTATTGRFGGIADLAALAPGTSAMEYSCYVLSAIATLTLNQLAPMRPGSAEWHDRLRMFIALAMVAALIQATCTFAFADGLARIVGCPPEIVSRAASYLRWRAPGVVPFHLAASCSSCFFAAKDSFTPFMGTLIAVVINIIGDLLLCPRHGLIGAAAATSLAQLCSFTFLFVTLRKRGLAPPNLLRSFAPVADLGRLLRLVAPVSMLTLLRTSLYAIMSFWCCQMGLVASAAQQIASTFFWGASSAAGEPISAAAQTFVPARYEAWREAAEEERTLQANASTDPLVVAAANERVAHTRAQLVLTIRRLASICALFGGFVSVAVYALTNPAQLVVFTSNTAAISCVPQIPLVAIAATCPFALLCEGTLLSMGARNALVRNLCGCVTLCIAVGSLLMGVGMRSVQSIWALAALFQFTRFLANGLVLRRKLCAPP